MTATAATRRYAALATLVNPITEDTTEETFNEIAAAVAQLSPLGRTDRWKAACRFAANEINTAKAEGHASLKHSRWAVLQGSVWMGYAAE